MKRVNTHTNILEASVINLGWHLLKKAERDMLLQYIADYSQRYIVNGKTDNSFPEEKLVSTVLTS